jgi:hypothetical protein
MNKISSTTLTNNVYCVAVDGSQSSEYAFDLVLNELFQKGDKIYVVHISNPEKLNELPFEYQPDTIISKYDTKLSGKILRSYFEVIHKEREPKNDHALVQVNEIAIAKKSTLLVMGFHGHKMINNKNELTKGISYIINNIKLPTIVVKEKSQRKKKDNNGFTWMSAIEDNTSRSFKAFQYSLNCVDINRDKVVGAHVKIYDDYWAREVKDSFEKICNDRGVLNSKFYVVEKPADKEIQDVLSDLVNFNENETVDFFVLGHNPGKYGNYNIKFKGIPVVEVIRKAQANILFYS